MTTNNSNDGICYCRHFWTCKCFETVYTKPKSTTNEQSNTALMQSNHLTIYVLGGSIFTINDDKTKLTILDFKQIMSKKDFIEFERQFSDVTSKEIGIFMLNNLEHSYVIENSKLKVN